jgi:hypothetical protein
MDVYTRHRWLVYENVAAALTPYWRLVGPDHLSDWEAQEWIDTQYDAAVGTRFRIVEVYWYPQIELIEEVTKK